MKFHVELEREGDSQMFEDLERYLRYHPRVTRFLFNPAGFTFLVGWILFAGMIIGWLGILFLDRAIGWSLMTVVGAQLTSGKEVSIPLGLHFGVPVLLVAGTVFVIDLLGTAWVYPLFYLFRKRNLGRENFAGYFFSRMEGKAATHRRFIERYGAIGLFVFMLVPFAVNGPLIGAIVGKLAGIRTRYILPTVILATAATTSIWTLGWVFARTQLEALTGRYGGHWLALAMVAIVLLVVGGSFLGFVRDARRYRSLRREREGLARRREPAAALPGPEPVPGGPSEPEAPPLK